MFAQVSEIVSLVVMAMLVAACGMILLRMRQHVQKSNAQHEQLLTAMQSRREELEAALSSMVEGVLAVDTDRKLISANSAAIDLLNLRTERDLGRSIDVVLDHEPLRAAIDKALQHSEPTQDDVSFRVDQEMRLFQVQGSVLRHRDGHRIGSLIVLHDVTRLRRLEVVRRDFVANASHEIRTPVAAIKMAAESLDPDQEQPSEEMTRKFLRIIVRQADRLQALIDDLLSLARIERDAEEQRLALDRKPIGPVLRSAAETCETAAAQRGSRILIDCPDDAMAAINGPLLEQAVVNLLDNALKYSTENATVRCEVKAGPREVVISVIDEGGGIDAEHLPRLFERFYRTDKARSRSVGGTGLGLAIVKHVAIAHGGRVSVDSRIGQGSVFRLHLPVQDTTAEAAISA